MKPVLLLIPGILNDAELWRDVVQRLRGDADVRIALPRAASIEAMAAAAWAELEDLSADAPLLLAGFSLGGYVAIEMLARPKRHINAALLVSTSARPESPEAAELRRQTIDAFENDFDAVMAVILRRSMVSTDSALRERLAQMMRRVGAQVAITQSKAIIDRADHRAALARLQMPLTVLCGMQDRITPTALSSELAVLVPGAELQLIDGSGHMLPFEQPQIVADALSALMASRAMAVHDAANNSQNH